MTDIIIEILPEILILFLGIYLAFFKSYFTEKGRQIAVKQDIEEITTKVESIKTDLELYKGNKLNLITEERESILRFLDSYHEWRTTIVLNSPYLIINNPNNYHTINENFNSHHHVCQQNIDRLALFFDDETFPEIKKKLMLKMLDLQQHSDSVMQKVYEYYKDKNHDINDISPKISEYLKEKEEIKVNIIKELLIIEKEMRTYFKQKLNKYDDPT
ncbi:MAG: hypothetical protein WDZ80_02430 [Candidatus Paceibacterota bacterium]